MTPLQSAGPSVVFQETAFRGVYKQTQIFQGSKFKTDDFARMSNFKAN